MLPSGYLPHTLSSKRSKLRYQGTLNSHLLAKKSTTEFPTVWISCSRWELPDSSPVFPYLWTRHLLLRFGTCIPGRLLFHLCNTYFFLAKSFSFLHWMSPIHTSWVAYLKRLLPPSPQTFQTLQTGSSSRRLICISLPFLPGYFPLKEGYLHVPVPLHQRYLLWKSPQLRDGL